MDNYLEALTILYKALNPDQTYVQIQFKEADGKDSNEPQKKTVIYVQGSFCEDGTGTGVTYKDTHNSRFEAAQSLTKKLLTQLNGRIRTMHVASDVIEKLLRE